ATGDRGSVPLSPSAAPLAGIRSDRCAVAPSTGATAAVAGEGSTSYKVPLGVGEPALGGRPPRCRPRPPREGAVRTQMTQGQPLRPSRIHAGCYKGAVPGRAQCFQIPISRLLGTAKSYYSHSN